jgi:hypothetical protein
MILLWMVGKPLSNVGDIITPYLYKKVTGKEPKNWTNYLRTNEDVIYGAGSILSEFTTQKNVIIWVLV